MHVSHRQASAQAFHHHGIEGGPDVEVVSQLKLGTNPDA